MTIQRDNYVYKYKYVMCRVCNTRIYIPVDQEEEVCTICKKKEPGDKVNSPKHYCLPNGVEVIDIIKHLLTEEEYRGYLKGNILKYTLRADRKGEAKMDRQKSKKYLEWLLDES